MYSILFVPVLFSVLVGVNLVAWSIARINYAFIFGVYHWLTVSFPPDGLWTLDLNSRTRINYREYFEASNLMNYAEALSDTSGCSFHLSCYLHYVMPSGYLSRA